MPHKKGELSAEGKTKKIWKVTSHPEMAIIEYKDDITAFDDPDLTRQFGTKGTCSTITTCRVFELLQKAGIPVAYQEQISSTEFLAQQCMMIPLEVVARRFAVGSYLKRNPEFAQEDGSPPYQFPKLVTEFFLKTTGGKLVGSDGTVLVEGLDTEDPFILNPYDENWELFHSKKPSSDPEAALGKSVKALDVTRGESMTLMERILRNVFTELEKAWSMFSLHFIDIKIEFGTDAAGNLRVADVIDNDSWRLQDENWEELSKESFRQGEELSKVEQNYGIVAALAEKFPV